MRARPGPMPAALRLPILLVLLFVTAQVNAGITAARDGALAGLPEPDRVADLAVAGSKDGGPRGRRRRGRRRRPSPTQPLLW